MAKDDKKDKFIKAGSEEEIQTESGSDSGNQSPDDLDAAEQLISEQQKRLDEQAAEIERLKQLAAGGVSVNSLLQENEVLKAQVLSKSSAIPGSRISDSEYVGGKKVKVKVAPRKSVQIKLGKDRAGVTIHTAGSIIEVSEIEAKRLLDIKHAVSLDTEILPEISEFGSSTTYEGSETSVNVSAA